MTLDRNGTSDDVDERLAALAVLRAVRDRDESILDKVDALRRIVIYNLLFDLASATVTEQTEAIVKALRGLEVPG